MSLIETAWRSAGQKAHVTSPLRMGNGLGRARIVTLRDVDEVCLHREQRGYQVINKITPRLLD